jgi:hypothetical protein
MRAAAHALRPGGGGFGGHGELVTDAHQLLPRSGARSPRACRRSST